MRSDFLLACGFSPVFPFVYTHRVSDFNTIRFSAYIYIYILISNVRYAVYAVNIKKESAGSGFFFKNFF